MRAAARELAADAPAAERLAHVLATFARRALRNPRLAWALIAEPVDPLVDAERLAYRSRYAAVIAKVGLTTGSIGYDNDAAGSSVARTWQITRTCSPACAYVLTRAILGERGPVEISASLVRGADGWHGTWPNVRAICHSTPGGPIYWSQQEAWILRFTHRGTVARGAQQPLFRRACLWLWPCVDGLACKPGDKLPRDGQSCVAGVRSLHLPGRNEAPRELTEKQTGRSRTCRSQKLGWPL